MNKILILAIIVLSISQIYLWKDQTQQWQILHKQIIMLNRTLDILNSGKPFVYEDEIPSEPLEEQQDI